MNQTNEELLKDIARVAAEVAVKTALEHLENEKLKEEKYKRDGRLRNTKLLLKHYRSFKLHCEDLKIELEELDETDDIFQMLTSNEFMVESIKRSKKRTLAIVKFVDQMLEAFQVLSERSLRSEEVRRFQVIQMMYISDKEFTVEEIADCHKTNVRTVYRDINEAVETLSVLVFGVDGIRLVK